MGKGMPSSWGGQQAAEPAAEDDGERDLHAPGLRGFKGRRMPELHLGHGR